MENHTSNDQEDEMEAPVEIVSCEDPLIIDLQKQLKLIISNQVIAKIINERDAHVLLLRLGLENGKCYTLTETSKITHISPEYLRQRQHLLLHKKIRDPKFFKALERYSHLVKLPRGVRYYLQKIE